MSKIMAADAPHDDQLPQLATVLDERAMAELFDELLFHPHPYPVQVELFPPGEITDNGLRLYRCEIERVKYKAGNNCLITYCLHFEDTVRGTPRSQRLCARVYPVGQSGSRSRRAQGRPFVQPEVGPSLVHLPELGMVIWGFPNDRKLLHLPKLMDRAYLSDRLLPPLVAAHLGDGWQIATSSHEVAHYAAEYTCTVRIQLQLLHRQTGEQGELTLFGKLYENEQGSETARLMRSLWKSEERVTGQFTMAQPLAYDPKLRILWQKGLNGKTLQSYALTSSGLESFASPLFLDLLGRTAETVAYLHQSPVTCSRTVQLGDHLRKLETMRDLLPQVWPPCRSAVLSLVEQLHARADSVGAQPLALLHGDLHLQNFFVEKYQVALIDMDELQRGSPWQDVGSLVAALHYRGLLAGRPLAEIEQAAARICTHYAMVSAWPISPAAIDWFTAAALINERAYRATTRLQSGSLAIVDALLARALYLLQRNDWR